jgi:hypothetical protein
MRCHKGRITWSAVVKLTIKGARQAGKYMRMMGMAPLASCMNDLSVVLKTRKKVPSQGRLAT